VSLGLGLSQLRRGGNADGDAVVAIVDELDKGGLVSVLRSLDAAGESVVEVDSKARV